MEEMEKEIVYLRNQINMLKICLVITQVRGVFFHKIFDALSRTFEGTYDDATTTLTIKSSETVWAGLRIIAIK